MKREKRDYDAVVVGSGPNGLAAAILMQQQGLSVLIIEGRESVGGGLASRELTLPGFIHDVCSAIHPMSLASPFFRTLPLIDFGLNFVNPPISAAHPFDDGDVAVLSLSVEKTANYMGEDARTYNDLMQSLCHAWPLIEKDAMGPLRFPEHPIEMAKFGLKALTSATQFVKRFKGKNARGLFAGMAAHAIQPLSNLSTSAIALVLLTAGHLKGWSIPRGGSLSIAKALAGYFQSIGGRIETGTYISSLSQMPSAHAVLFDITPRQLMKIAGQKFSSTYKWQLNRYRYGMGVFKIDWALNEPIPFKTAECRMAGTLHLGNTFEEIAQGELQTSLGIHTERPFVLLAQQSLFDDSRAPAGKETGWAYCHVPNGSTKDMTDAIEKQVERFAPGFRDTIIGRHTLNTSQLELYNPNYIGGDINGGVLDIGQLFTRPALRLSPYKTSKKGIYICSSSTPPGGGVHGMCGYNAAKAALKDVFSIKL
ncbi:NAD(P)/FAD-dependent oxidoreductase [Pedobacter chinensis]|uniref:NAD(P)/FAD-dependent oxidoreductase n=1 Tax=Pedobacter chinensis TaxID=2282421 RepID=A0A369PSY8_9SPHI|nr:NAD(P)/FAD-dependent oxidoreductase [Pedobacter chinensis]RDC55370.1 NAD(P)/FAD-dependent oxidoreductase [Pedobacter chinensis]